MNMSHSEAGAMGRNLATNSNRMPVQVVFDTAKYPPPEGIHYREITSRHMLFQTSDHCLDLRVERNPQTAGAAIVGQLADRQDPLKPVPDIPVFLISGERILGQATSNRQGEFRVQYSPERHMSLCLPVAQDRLIVVPVDRRMMDRRDETASLRDRRPAFDLGGPR